jgi:3-dehydroquinate synthase
MTPDSRLLTTLTVGLGNRSYPIYIGNGLIDSPELLSRHAVRKKVAVVTNPVVADRYLERLNRSLADAGITSVPIILPDGEDHKTWASLNLIFDQMLGSHCDRQTTVMALGGGVVGDMAGFAAATYMRGIPYIQIPTTLLAQVDSSVGGKTAINHPLGKNMIGAFYQPRAVIADIAALATLPEREYAAGLAEIIKYGFIMDLRFLEWLEQNMDRLRARDVEAIAHAVARSCECKADIVGQDESEQGIRAILNLGHTFGHAIETGLGYGEWLHGEAVAAGCLMAARLSCRLGDLTEADVERVRSVLERAGLPVDPPALGVNRYLELMGHDKKTRDGKLILVLLRSLGQAYMTDQFPMAMLRDVLGEGSVHA